MGKPFCFPRTPPALPKIPFPPTFRVDKGAVERGGVRRKGGEEGVWVCGGGARSGRGERGARAKGGGCAVEKKAVSRKREKEGGCGKKSSGEMVVVV